MHRSWPTRREGSDGVEREGRLRRSARARGLLRDGRQAEVEQDLLHGGGLVDNREHAHAPLASAAFKDVDGEHALEERRPVDAVRARPLQRDLGHGKRTKWMRGGGTRTASFSMSSTPVMTSSLLPRTARFMR